MSRMIILRKFGSDVFGRWPIIRRHKFADHYNSLSTRITAWHAQNRGVMRNLVGAYMAVVQMHYLDLGTSSKSFATQPPFQSPSQTSKPTEPDENNPINVVLREIRSQERQFRRKLELDEALSARKIKPVDSVPLNPTKQLELLRSSSATSHPPIQIEQVNTAFEIGSTAATPSAAIRRKPALILDDNRVTQVFTQGDTQSKQEKKPLPMPMITPKEPFREPLKFQGKPQSLKITYPNPKPTERMLIPFKFDTNPQVLPPPPVKLTPQIPSTLPSRVLKLPGSSKPLPPPPPVELAPLPKISESNTHKVKLLIANSMKPLEGTTIANDLGSLKYKVDVKSRILMMFQPEKKDLKTQEVSDSEVEVSGPVDILGNPIPPKENRLITSMVMDKEMDVVTGVNICGLSAITPRNKGDNKGEELLESGTNLNSGGDSSSGGGKTNTKETTRWTVLRYTLEFCGLAITALGGYVIYKIGQPKCDEWGNVILDKYSHMPLVFQYFYRVRDQMEIYQKMIKEPSREKLLPDIMQPPYYQPPYTLILELTDLLVHPEWTYKTGWRFKKRPGLDEFLEALYTRFEVVVYTAQMATTVFPLLETLDQKNLITYKLVRDATNFVEGDHVKDLDKLNRDLRKVVVVDWNPRSVKLHKCNLFQIPRWEGNDDDRTLFDLAAFLIAISEWEVQDVRAVLEYYGQFDNPLMKFKENQMQALRATQF